jgi:hypothetical protein
VEEVRQMRSTRRLIAGCVIVLFAAACGGDGGGGGGGGGGEPTAVSFTPQNAVALAGQAAACLDFFAQLTRTVAALSDRLVGATGSGTPGEEIDLGDLGLCATGQAVATFTDVDGDGAPSTGDAVRLQLTACDGQADGTLTVTIVTAGDFPVADLAVDVTVRDQVDGALKTVIMSGEFQVQIEPAGPGTLAIRFQVADNTASAPGLLTTVNGTIACDLGCFNIFFAVHAGDGSFEVSYPLAVFAIPGQGVMSLGGWGMPAVVFDADGVPQSGQLGLYPESSVLPCARIGVGGGGIDTNDSVCTITAAAGGAVTVAGRTAGGSPFSLQTTWDDLR